MENRIGEARRSYAAEHGRFTQKDAASFFGVSESAYKKWEQGKGYLNGAQLRAIADKYGVTVDYLVMNDTPRKMVSGLSEREAEMLAIMREISPLGIEQLMIYARGIAATYPKSDSATRSA